MTTTASVGTAASDADKFSCVLEGLWAPIRERNKDAHGIVNIDGMVKAVTNPKSDITLPVKLDPTDIASLKEIADDLKADHWITEGRRRFILAGTLGEMLAMKAIDQCNEKDCMRACEAAQQIGKSDDRHAVLAAMLLLPETEFQDSQRRYKGDGWMISGHFKVPLEGVDLRRKWDRAFVHEVEA